jgi:hypothetical protein
MGPLSKLLKSRAVPQVPYLDKFVPGYGEFMGNSGIDQVTLKDLIQAGLHYTKNKEKFGDHAVVDNLLKGHTEPYGYTPTVKAARSYLGSRDYAERFPKSDKPTLKNQAVLYQYIQGLKGLDFTGDTIDALYNKYGIDQARSTPPLNEMDYVGIQDLFDEFGRMIR